jgi:choloylglycine hydrolase
MTGGNFPGAAQWTSKYGSVVCSIIPYARKYGFEVDDGGTDGINEKGLGAHVLYLEATQYAEPDATPAVSYLRWARYILDNFATVKEAVEGMKNIRIAAVKLGKEVLGAHLAIEDPSGDNAIFEVLDGKLVIHHGQEYTVMTNDPPYDWQVVNLSQYNGFGGSKSMPGSIEPGDRFVRLAYYTKHLPDPETPEQAVGYAMSAIRNVAVPFGAPYGGRTGAATYPTWWMSATDLDRGIYFFNWAKNPNIVWIHTKEIDYSEGSGCRVVDPKDPALAGDITRSFKPLKE